MDQEILNLAQNYQVTQDSQIWEQLLSYVRLGITNFEELYLAGIPNEILESSFWILSPTLTTPEETKSMKEISGFKLFVGADYFVPTHSNWVHNFRTYRRLQIQIVRRTDNDHDEWHVIEIPGIGEPRNPITLGIYATRREAEARIGSNPLKSHALTKIDLDFSPGSPKPHRIYFAGDGLVAYDKYFQNVSDLEHFIKNLHPSVEIPWLVAQGFHRI